MNDLLEAGKVELSQEWTVFVLPQESPGSEVLHTDNEYGVILGPTAERVKRALNDIDPLIASGIPANIPDKIKLRGSDVWPQMVSPILGQVDLRPLLGSPPFAKGAEQTPDESACGRVAYVFIPVKSPTRRIARFGFGADLALTVWLNGKSVYEWDGKDLPFPPNIQDIQCDLNLEEGENLLFIRFVSGKGSSLLAVGGPAQLREYRYPSILCDPILAGEEQWTNPELRLNGVRREAVTIGGNRELFVDDHLIDQISSTAELRLHHPEPREIVFCFDRPWEGNFNACFQPISLFRDGDRILMYYKGANFGPLGDASEVNHMKRDRSRPEITCLAYSSDGIHFDRPDLGLVEIDGSKRNNVIWDGPQFFTPFLDTRPEVSEEERFKAISGHHAGGLGAYVSPDGLSWQLHSENPIQHKGAFDSQNTAFWDSFSGCYREYHRGNERSGPRREVRGIMTSTSPDFRTWSEPEPVEYFDEYPHQLYTNCILPYHRAKQILLGTPGRMVVARKKLSQHPDIGVTDTLLMAGRGGYRFKRWHEGFIRPNVEPMNWADRNTFPAWGILQTSPSEISLYWCEHNGFPSLRLRRGVIRTDGFVSLHAGSEVGELLTGPFFFKGVHLSVNYATSAAGSLRFEICRADGRPFEGKALADSDILYGNELDGIVSWKGSPDLSALAGEMVRLRIRLQDADLYSFQFQT